MGVALATAPLSQTGSCPLGLSCGTPTSGRMRLVQPVLPSHC